MENDTDTIDLRYETKYSEGVNAKAIEKEIALQNFIAIKLPNVN